MNKIFKVFLCIIIVLLVVVGYLFYKVIYFKNGYLDAANQLYEQGKLLEDSGIEIIRINDGDPEIHIKQVNNVIMDN